MTDFFITAAVAILGSILGKKLHVPAGILLGSIFSVAVLQIFFHAAAAPPALKILSQGIVGTHIGSLLSKHDFIRLKQMWPAALTLLGMLLAFNVVSAIFLNCVTELSIITAICSLAPCSIADMSLLCQELGGNAGAVACIQALRLLAILSLTPLVAQRTIPQESEKPWAIRHTSKYTWNIYSSITLGLGLCASWLGYALHIPAGCLSFSMVAVGVYQLIAGKATFHAKLRKPAQCLSGMLVGGSIYLEQLQMMVHSLPAVALVLLGFVGLNLLMARMLAGKHMSYATALFATAPGGMSDMGLLAAEFGGDLVTVAFFQQLRYIGVILLYPPLIRLFSDML